MSQSVKYLDKSDIKLASLIIFGALGFTLLAVSIFKHVIPNSNVDIIYSRNLYSNVDIIYSRNLYSNVSSMYSKTKLDDPIDTI